MRLLGESVAHFEQDVDRMATVTGQAMRWVATRTA